MLSYTYIGATHQLLIKNWLIHWISVCYWIFKLVFQMEFLLDFNLNQLLSAPMFILSIIEICNSSVEAKREIISILGEFFFLIFLQLIDGIDGWWKKMSFTNYLSIYDLEWRPYVVVKCLIVSDAAWCNCFNVQTNIFLNSKDTKILLFNKSRFVESLRLCKLEFCLFKWAKAIHHIFWPFNDLYFVPSPFYWSFNRNIYE